MNETQNPDSIILGADYAVMFRPTPRSSKWQMFAILSGTGLRELIHNANDVRLIGWELI